MAKVVKWKVHGQLIQAGEALARAPGDEDVVDDKLARSMATCGQVDVVGDVKQVLSARVAASVEFPERSIEEEEDDEHAES